MRRIENIGVEDNFKEKKTIEIKTLIISAIIVGLVIGVVWMQSERYEPILVGKMAPDFIVKDMNGKEVKLSDYRGKVVFVNFWATWCKPCREEMPSMQVMYDALKSQDFELLAVSIDKWPSAIKGFTDELKISFPVLHDQWGKVDRRYKLTGVPESYIVDKDGKLAEKIIGPRDWTKEESVKALLSLLQNGGNAASPSVN